ncbi:MAG: restriction endonuclease subunit S [Zoogloea oleivorans]|jgi:type I restriction enzyme S subunit|uniref:restriction endonuclease subunit S n=1 Tax=Zoogloea oleivorans TaxID=1552750 RepID=UPI002A35B6FA|nr:restriction endonuclease subunit S [Zoogloea oleivorans]MDY0036945.1 restriction endonuclease subunit S [Zoogloea oleivorans]
MELLEQHFDTAFSAANGIQKLRELILTLAMQGKLVPQDPNDTPASELLKDIESEKRRLVKEGKIKSPKPLPTIAPEETPYTLPEGWSWIRLIEIGYWALGSGLPHSIQGDTGQEILLCKVSDMNLPGNEKYIFSAKNTVSQELAEKSKLSISEPGTIIFPKIGGAIATNKRRILNRKTVIDNNCLGIKPCSVVSLAWAYQLFLLFDFSKYQMGTSVPAISQSTIGEIVIGLPPIEEQIRIVAKIDQLMARCDDLEKLRSAHEQKRVAVHTSAINQLLNASEPVEHARALDFLARHFSELHSVTENVAKVRKAILQLAVMGKAVPQDPNDPPASELLKEIEIEKKRRVKEGKVKATKPLPPIALEKTQYSLPRGWTWVRLAEISDINGGFAFKSSHYVSDGIRVVRISDFDERGFKNDKVVRYNYSNDLRNYQLEINSILMAMTGGTVGKSLLVADLPEPMVVNQRVATIRLVEGIVPEFVNIVIQTDLIQGVIQNAKNSTNDNISMADINNFLVPLPSFVEQKRIVAKVRQLMAMCDSLEQKISDAILKKSALLDAVMMQAKGIPCA